MGLRGSYTIRFGWGAVAVKVWLRIILALSIGTCSLAARPDEASDLLDRGNVLAREGKYQDALDATQRGCELRRQALGDDHEATHRCRTDLARRFVELRRPAEGEIEAQRSATRLTELRGASDPGTLEARQILAVCAFLLGRYGDAERIASDVYEARRAALGSDHADTLSSLNTMAAALQERGEYRQARDLFLRLSEAYEATRGPTDRATLVARNNLAASHFLLGEYASAEVLYAQVHVGRVATLGPRHPSTLAVMTSLADAKLGRGRSVDALDHVLALDADYSQVFGEKHPETLRHRDLLARIYVDIGRFDQAALISKAVVVTSVSELGPAHPSTIRYTVNLGRSLYYLRDYANALNAYEAAAVTAPSALGQKHPVTLQVHSGRAYCHLRLEQHELALATFGQALEASEGVLAETHPNRLAYRNGLHEAQFALGNRELALRGMESTLEQAREVFGARNERVFPYLGTLANYLLVEGRRDRAEHLLEQYLAIAEATRAEGFLGAEFRQGRLAVASEGDEWGLGLKALVELRIARGDLVGALRVSELLKARTLGEAMDLRSRAVAAGLSKQDVDDLSEQLRRLESLESAAAGLTPGSVAAIANAGARQEAERAAHRVAAKSGRAEVSVTREGIARDAVFVSFIVNRDRAAALVMRRSGPVKGFVLGALPGLAGTIDAYRRWIASQIPERERVWRLPDGSYRWSLAQPQGARRVPDISEMTDELSRRLIAPLAAELRSVRAWQLSPDGSLALIPFEALTLDGTPVIARHDVTYVQSLDVLAKQRQRAREGPVPEGLLAVAAGEGTNLPALPGANAEIDAVAKAHAGQRTVLLKGAGATESAIRALASRGELSRFRYLHFAAHGFLSTTHPQLSAIVLAGDGRSSESDGYLSAAEWPSLRLRSELAVISSCDSGAGRIVSGEGVLGLPYALTVAGNRRTVLSLWEVNDRASAEFMPAFHRRLRAGLDPGRALAETKRQFARSGSPWRDPRHWAPFVLYGG
ncbi:CHAT domain-containing tetratricopeptide repeat protein [Usitatibacter palustris]|uniref:CHAT domain-containing protein n=1 Tax=Usitatibacter palustris TaxID=2732487 RepID=A0A6M4HCI7_9PROT|nr:CHAT domain-containing tetratricopeptide repeat protein [Usitatibacter palustris]QJR16952.1 hypothetical protein DSM104440_03789 [Usitatibacter palustris]